MQTGFIPFGFHSVARRSARKGPETVIGANKHGQTALQHERLMGRAHGDIDAIYPDGALLSMSWTVRYSARFRSASISGFETVVIQ